MRVGLDNRALPATPTVKTYDTNVSHTLNTYVIKWQSSPSTVPGPRCRR